MDAAEGGVGGGPDFYAGGVRREDRAADVIGADEADHPTLDHGDRIPAVPDIFAEEGTRGLVVFGDAAAVQVEGGVDGNGNGRGEGSDRLATAKQCGRA